MTDKNIAKRLEYLRGEIRAERISYGEIAELQDLAVHIDPHDVELLQWAGVSEEEYNRRLASPPPSPASFCPGQHTWIFVRRYTGTESYSIKTLIDQDTGDEIDPATVAPDDVRFFDVVCFPDAESDSYDSVIEEYLQCQYCPATITPERVGDMDTTFD